MKRGPSSDISPVPSWVVKIFADWREENKRREVQRHIQEHYNEWYKDQWGSIEHITLYQEGVPVRP